MDRLQLRLGDLNLQIRLIERQIEEAGKPYLDWLLCELGASISSFSGTVRWSVMPRELTGLADDLTHLYSQFPRRGSLVFEPTEPNILLNLEVQTTGIIT